MSSNWKNRRRRRAASGGGGSYVLGALKGTVAGAVLLGAAGLALLSFLPPIDETDGDGSEVAALNGQGGARTNDARAREARGRAGPTSMGSFAEQEVLESAVSAPRSAPAVSAPVSAPGALGRTIPTAPAAAESGSAGIAGLGAGEATGAFGNPLQAPSGATGLAPAPSAPPGFGSPAGLRDAGATAPVDPSDLTAEEARAALAALEAAEAGAAADGSAPEAGYGPTTDPSGPSTDALLQADPASLSENEARAALAALEAAEGAQTDQSADLLAADPESLPPEDARATLAALEGDTAPIDTEANTEAGPAVGDGPADGAATGHSSAPLPTLGAVDAPAQSDGAATPADPVQPATPGATASVEDQGGNGFTFVTTPEGPGQEADEEGDASSEEIAVAAVTPAVPSTTDEGSTIRVPVPRPGPAAGDASAAPDEPIASTGESAPATKADAEPDEAPASYSNLGRDAFADNAVPFDLNAGAQPLAIVLVATPGSAEALPALLERSKAKLAVALPPGLEGASALQDEAGDEIEIVVAVAGGDSRSAALSGATEDPVLAALAQLPEAVAAMPMPGARGVSRPEAMFDTLAKHGFGYLDPRPLGSAASVRAAQAEGIPAAAIDRQAGGTGSEADVYRAIQVAAGVARRQGNAILIAPATEQAVAAIAAWQEEDRTGSVVLAPLSTVIKAKAR